MIKHYMHKETPIMYSDGRTKFRIVSYNENGEPNGSSEI